MSKLLADTKIGMKIIVPLILLAIFGLGSISYASWQMKAVDDGYSEMYDTDTTALVATLRFNRSIQTLAYNAYIPMAYDGASKQAQDAKTRYLASVEQAGEFLDAAAAASPEWQGDVDRFRASLASILEDSNAAVAQGMANDADTARITLTRMDSKIADLQAQLVEFNDGKMQASLAENGSRTDATNSAIVMVLLVFGVSSLIAIMASLSVVSKGVTGPLNQLRDLMSKLANADFSVDVVGQDRKDEVGQMAQTVQVFKENGIRARELEVEATRTRETTERERAIVAREQEKVVNQLADGLSRLSDGDLAFTLNERFGEEYEKLRADFNAAMTKLKQTMQTVSGNTHGIRGGADEISQAADDLSRRTEQQAASLEETAAALDEITATVRTTAENANEARRVVAEASESAKHSGEVVGQAVEAMSKIEKSSQQISQIIGVIDEIAFQTNLLALNAGVEAARAGDAGRGFAVVASEVRALAQRSAEAAKEIKTLISASSTQVDQGVSLVAETGTALKGIVDQVARINHLVADIAASAQEQATGLQQVNTAVNQMDQVTQQNAAMVEESTAASHSLAQETEQLSRLIGQFRTGVDDRPVSAAPKRAVHKAPPQRAAQTTHTAMKTTGYGGAAVKHQPQAAEEGWEEF